MAPTRGGPFFLGGACLITGCLGLLGGGDGVPNPSDAGRVDAARDHSGRDAGEGGEGGGKPGGAAVAVSSGSFLQNWCVVTANGDVECWGDNEVGELGDGTTRASAIPVKVQGLTEPAIQVSVGYTTVCALTKSRGVWCWGYGMDGELGDGKTAFLSAKPVRVTGLTSGVLSLSVGDVDACAVKQDGSVWCWGYAGGDLLGNGATKNSLVPTQVTGMTSGATSVAVGGNSACAIRAGAVLCWGADDGLGELGNGSTIGSPHAVAVTGLTSDVTAVSVGDTSACALTKAGAVFCWGEGDYGQLGNSSFANSSVPVQVTGLTSGVNAISAGNGVTCALARDGSVACWGFGADGELGTGPTVVTYTRDARAFPAKVEGLSGKATAISTGDAPCAVLTNGGVECWGFTAEVALTPVTVPNLTGASAVAIGGFLDTESFACALAGGGIECWGGNGYGQLGNGRTAASPIPVNNLILLASASGITAGPAGNFACGINSGLAMCWGENTSGQLGNQSTVSTPTPVTVHGLTGVTAVAAGSRTACAITSGGGLSCWGDNTLGELGNNSTASSSVPVQVQGLTSGVNAVSVGIDYACAALSDGTLDCWGNNTSGQLGDGSGMTRLVPTRVPGLTAVTAVSAGWYTACAVTSGALACWGDNNWGELGVGNAMTPGSLFPLAVTGVSSGATQVAVGQQSACAIVSGGVQCWGAQALGIGQTGTEYAPVPATGLSTGATSIAVGVSSACAVVKGAVRCWGFNTAGQLGNGGAVDAFLPTPVPGFP